MKWAADPNIATAPIDPGKPWQSGANESFNGMLRNECVSLEWFRSLAEVLLVIELERAHYNKPPHRQLEKCRGLGLDLLSAKLPPHSRERVRCEALVVGELLDGHTGLLVLCDEVPPTPSSCGAYGVLPSSWGTSHWLRGGGRCRAAWIRRTWPLNASNEPRMSTGSSATNTREFGRIVSTWQSPRAVDVARRRRRSGAHRWWHRRAAGPPGAVGCRPRRNEFNDAKVAG